MNGLRLSDKHEAIARQTGHILVTGGPGSGKTTIALLKGQRRTRTLLPGQEVLFLSFSRSAINQIMSKSCLFLSREERSLLHVQTYHSFCIETLHSHGRLLAGRPCRFILPGPERIKKSTCATDWAGERTRLARSESLYCFDLVASGVAELFERSASVRNLYGASFPLIIVDEFQDTDDDQWRMVRALARVTEVFCLADPDQRIFEYRQNVDPRRLEQLRAELAPAEFDLADDNHRSPESGILRFADAVLANRAPLPATNDVRVLTYRGNEFASLVHAATAWTFGTVRRRGVAHPAVAVLCRSNTFVADLAAIFREEHTFKGRRMLPITHDVVWDAELSAAAAAVVGSIMEWPGEHALSRTLALISGYFMLKNAEQPSRQAAMLAQQYSDSSRAILNGNEPEYKAAKVLRDCFLAGILMIGEPVEDWRNARKLLAYVKQLNSLFRDATLVRLYGARDALAAGLGEAWITHGHYRNANNLVKKILDRERLLSVDRTPSGCVLMTIHKSKGKEFDGVVLVEGKFKSRFFDTDQDGPPFEKSRRLLRVAMTRARIAVTIVRPKDGPPLVG